MPARKSWWTGSRSSSDGTWPDGGIRDASRILGCHCQGEDRAGAFGTGVGARRIRAATPGRGECGRHRRRLARARPCGSDPRSPRDETGPGRTAPDRPPCHQPGLVLAAASRAARARCPAPGRHEGARARHVHEAGPRRSGIRRVQARVPFHGGRTCGFPRARPRTRIGIQDPHRVAPDWCA